MVGHTCQTQMGQANYTRINGGLVGGSKQPWWWRGRGADGAGSQGVAVPQRWVQILAKSAKRLPSYGCGIGGWGRGRMYFYVAFSHFSLFTSWALGTWNGELKKEDCKKIMTILAFWSAICDLPLFTFGKHLNRPKAIEARMGHIVKAVLICVAARDVGDMANCKWGCVLMVKVSVVQ